MTMFKSMCDAETIAHHPGLGHLRDSYGWGARVRGSETDEACFPGSGVRIQSGLLCMAEKRHTWRGPLCQEQQPWPPSALSTFNNLLGTEQGGQISTHRCSSGG